MVETDEQHVKTHCANVLSTIEKTNTFQRVNRFILLHIFVHIFLQNDDQLYKYDDINIWLPSLFYYTRMNMTHNSLEESWYPNYYLLLTIFIAGTICYIIMTNRKFYC